MNSPTDNVFIHKPLPDSTTHIRLLELLQANFDQHVICKLSTWPIDNAPKYLAISYTWGDPELTTLITINGKQMTVRRNCEYALQQIGATKEFQYIWIDAICIDQNAVQEKNHQVAMMGQIYSKAAGVHACVGPHADDSEFIVEVTLGYRNLLHRVLKQVAHKDLFGAQDWERMERICQSRWLVLQMDIAMNTQYRRRLLEAYSKFISRDYFNRIWVLQELYLSSNAILRCGHVSIKIKRLLALHYLIAFWSCRSRYTYSGSINTFFFRLMKKTAMKNRIVASELTREQRDTLQQKGTCFVLNALPKNGLSLAQVLRIVGHFACADVRDRLYGVLHLISWDNEHGIMEPDYDKDSFDIVAELLVRLSTLEEEYMSYWARKLTDMFELSLDFGRIRSAFEVAHRNASPSNPSTYIDSHYNAYTVLDWINDMPGTEEARAAGLYLRRTMFGDYVELSGKDGVLCAYGPPEVRADDICLRRWGFPCDEVYLVLRKTDPSRFRLIGLANSVVPVYHRAIADACSYSEMHVHWHAIELQVFAILYRHAHNESPDPKVRNKVLNQDIPGLQWSSYAVEGKECHCTELDAVQRNSIAQQ